MDAELTDSHSPTAIAAALHSPGVSVGEGRGPLEPEVAGSIPAGATATLPTWCSSASIRSCHGRDPGSNPGVGVRSGMLIEAGSPCPRTERGQGAGPGRVCNLHDPMDIPGMPRSTLTSRWRTVAVQSFAVAQLYRHITNRGSLV